MKHNINYYKSLLITKFLLSLLSIKLSLSITHHHPKRTDGESQQTIRATADRHTSCAYTPPGGTGHLVNKLLGEDAASKTLHTDSFKKKNLLPGESGKTFSAKTTLKNQTHFSLSSTVPTPTTNLTNQVMLHVMSTQLKLGKLILVRHYSLVSEKSLSHLFTQRA